MSRRECVCGKSGLVFYFFMLKKTRKKQCILLLVGLGIEFFERVSISLYNFYSAPGSGCVCT